MLNIKFETKDPEVKKEVESIFDNVLKFGYSPLPALYLFSELLEPRYHISTKTQKYGYDITSVPNNERVAIITDLEK